MIKFNIGDKVRCKLGFVQSYPPPPPKGKYGGSGYISGKEIIINHMNINSSRGGVYWELNNSCGIFGDALELVTDEVQYEIY